MPIPTFAELMLPVLKYSAEKVWAMRDLVARIADDLDLSQEKRDERTLSGSTTIIASRGPAQKGVFITISTFTKTEQDAAKQTGARAHRADRRGVPHKPDGPLQHGRPHPRTVEAKRTEIDYFEEVQVE